MAARPPTGQISDAGSRKIKLEAAWRDSTLRSIAARNANAKWEAKVLSRKSPIYSELHRIFEETGDEIFQRALHALYVYGLDTVSSTKSLKRKAKELRRSEDYELAISGVSKCIQYLGVRRTTARQIATAQLSIYPTANSFDAAVQQVKLDWLDFKERKAELYPTSTVYFI
jgi:hypothetical protein